MLDTLLKQSVDRLRLSDNYKVIERYEKPQYYCLDNGKPKYKGVFLDVETTGVFIPEDKIIELGLVVFEFSEDGEIFRVLEEFSQYQDPGRSIHVEIIELTGITNEKVKGCRLDKEVIIQYLAGADIIIAHHAAFDRVCIEALWEDIPVKPWACSMMQVPWRQEGIESAKLEYLAYRFGFFYEGHRASIDCLAGVHLLSKELPRTKQHVLKTLLENSKKTTFRIWALDAPIAQKDILKRRQYRWNPGNDGKYKAWSIELPEEKVLEELKFLWQEVYPYQVRLPVEIINAKTRFSRGAVLPQHWVKNLDEAKELMKCSQ